MYPQNKNSITIKNRAKNQTEKKDQLKYMNTDVSKGYENFSYF
jgi:hypothetical protein